MNCKERTAENPDLGTHDCHMSCPKYKEYKKDHFAWAKAIFDKRMHDMELNCVERKRFSKYYDDKNRGRI